MFTRNYRLLAYFAEVVDSGSIRAAARKLFVSAPVVSKAIADLEASLNTSLLIRNKRRLSLTGDGEKVYAQAARMARAAIDALGSVDQIDAALQGHLEINLPTELASAWLPSILSTYRSRYPGVTVSVFASDQLEPERQTRHQVVIRADYALRPPPDEQPYIETLPLCLVLRSEMKPGGRHGAQARLREIPLIGFTQSRQPGQLSAIDTRTGRQVEFNCHSDIWVNNAQVIKEMVLQGYGAGLLTKHSVRSEIERGHLVEIDDHHAFGFICLQVLFRDQYPSAAARAFHGLLRARDDRLRACDSEATPSKAER